MAANHQKVNVDTVTSGDQNRLKKNNGDTITWDSGKNKKWLVVFDPKDSPFDDFFFHEGNKRADKIKVAPSSSKQYKYTVSVAGSAPVDPNVVIE